jgi:hypothetical protein
MMKAAADSVRKNNGWRIIAVELSEHAPRRNPSLPHLYVGITKSTFEDRFATLKNGAGPKEIVGEYVRIRQDLIEVEDEFKFQRSAKAALRREKIRLTRLGHAINGIATMWHTYVVDLDPTGMSDVGKGYVYVGQTSRTPEERYAVHKSPRPKPPARDLRSKVVHKRGVGLNYSLMKQLTPTSPVYTQEDALALEKKWALRLLSMGYRVEAGDATPHQKPATSKR